MKVNPISQSYNSTHKNPRSDPGFSDPTRPIPENPKKWPDPNLTRYPSKFGFKFKKIISFSTKIFISDKI
jgi:hypothetical protein